MSTPYRPPMSKSHSNEPLGSRESRTWTSRPRESAPSSGSGRQFDHPRQYDNRRQSDYRNDRQGYTPRFQRDSQVSPKEKPIPTTTSEKDFPSLTKTAPPQVAWSQIATPQPVVEPVKEKPASGWSNVVVKMATQQSEIEAQLAEEKRERKELEAQIRANEAKYTRINKLQVPLSSGGIGQSVSYEEEDDYIPDPAYGDQTPLDDDDYDDYEY